VTSFSIDDSELRTLRVDLTGAPLRAQLGARSRINRGRIKVEAGMRRDARGITGNWFGKPGTSFDTGLQRHVSSEMLTPLSAEIGIRPGGAGSLAHILTYGSVNNGPAWDHTASLRRATPGIERDIADMGEDATLGGKR
jgi:hypothetical protein